VVKLIGEKSSRSGLIHLRFAVVTEHSPMIESQLSRRALLRATVAASAGLVAGPAVLRGLPAVASTASFVDNYRTNISANLTVDTNAAVRALSGMRHLWQTGAAWNTGAVLDAAALHAGMRYAARISRTRTAADEARAFLQDRQNQSYAAIAGLGPWAASYRAGALAVTSITSAPAGTPATTVDDTVPAGAPAGSALGAGSPTSALGQVVTLVNTLRGSFSSGNPSKAAYQYPRPWRMNADSVVVDTGTVDALGFPVYDSPVTVVPQLLRQRSATPASDGGFPSGHTNAFFLAALAFAYAIPERFQELVTAAFDLAETRIIAGMHSPVDVIGGRILATALAAAILNDPANATLKAAARAQARAYFGSEVPAGRDAYADRAANERLVTPKLTYGLPRGRPTTAFVVPAGAEVLLETRHPYLSAEQRREVLRTTAVGAGWALLDGPEGWGRLNLFAAADGYGSFDRDVVVALDTADAWRNDIDGRGGLIKTGAGALTLTGDNTYRGGTTIAGGALVAASARALGCGDLVVAGGGTLAVSRSLDIDGDAVLGGTLSIDGHCARDLTVLRARRIQGRFATVVAPAGYRADVSYSRTAVTVHLRRA
jgi:autotransporter-associated beta strand protein